MMKLTERQKELLSKQELIFFYIVSIEIGSTTYRFSSHDKEVTFSNGLVIPGHSRVLSLAPPRRSSTVDRELYKVVLADPDFELVKLADDNIIGASIESRVIFIDPITDAVEANFNNSFIAYQGQVDSVGSSTNTDEIGENLFTVYGSSPMAKLDTVRSPVTSPFYQKNNILPSDTAFDFVFDKSINLKWGKE